MANGQPGQPDRDPQRPTDEFAQAAKDEGRAVKEQAREAAAEMKAGARDVAEDVKEQVRSTAAHQKDAAAQQMDGLAHALKSASDDLHGRGQDSVAAWVRQAADGLERASGTVRERERRRPDRHGRGFRAPAAGGVSRRRRRSRVRARAPHEELGGSPSRPTTGSRMGASGMAEGDGL